MRFSLMIGSAILGLAVLVGTGTSGGEKKEKIKGFLPNGWKDLGLSADQKEKIYKIQMEYKAKIEELKDAERKLKATEKGELVKILTESQKEHLQKLAVGDTTKKKTEEKKSDEKK